jgi:hypothetical protein
MRKGRGAHRRARSISAAVAVGACVVGLLIPGKAGTSLESPSHQRLKSQYWITTRGTNAAIDEIDPRLGKEVLESRNTVALGGWNASGGSNGTWTGASWASYAAFRTDLRRGMISPDLRAAMYDPEKWDGTPLNEQRDPIAYSRKFARLAHRHGWFAIVTPHPGLVTVHGGACPRNLAEREEAAYVRCGIAAGVARYADAYETQAQALEDDPRAYRAFVQATAVQARSANPDVVVLSGLSTSPGYPATAEMLYAAWSSVSEVVDGHYLSLARLRHPEVAAEFLAEIPRPVR